MALVRLVSHDDLKGLLDLANNAPIGLTTLQNDPDRLAQRIEDSINGAAPLLVMTDPSTGAIIGTGGFTRGQTQADLIEPFYAYRIERSVFHSQGLGVRSEVEALHLYKSYVGPTEVGTLFIHPNFQGGGYGRLLSLSRFQLLAQLEDTSNIQVIAELRGVLDQAGRSAFWDAVGQHFFRIDYSQADALSARDKRFIAELLPSHPIYVPLLPKAAQQVIGQVHPNTQPALRMLKEEGFHYSDMVDIFDAGPCVRCDLAAIRSVRDSRTAAVLGWIKPDVSPVHASYLVSTRAPFSAVKSTLKVTSDGVLLPKAIAEQLSIQRGDTVGYTPLSAGSNRSGTQSKLIRKQSA